jgi:DNA topoisomerase III
LSKEEQQLYDLIVRRFLAQFYPPAEYKQHTVLTVVEQETFRTAVKELLSLGWKVTLPDKDKARAGSKTKRSNRDGEGEEQQEEVETDKPFVLDRQLPVQCRKAEVKEKETQPPKPYTEGTLLKAMESAGKQIENEELRDAMKESGLGTPATRAATIERLKQVGYVQAKGKKIELALKGRAAIELIRAAGVELLTSPEMTGQWERRLNQISRGEADPDRFLESVKKFAGLVVDKVRTQTPAAADIFGDEGTRGKGKGKRTTRSSSRSSSTTRSSSASGSKRSTGTRGKSGSRQSATAMPDDLPLPVPPPESEDGYASSRSQASGDRASTSNISRSAHSSTAATRTRPAASNPSAAPAHTALGTCPRSGCGGTIIEGKKGYGCSHFRQGCGFVVWKEFAGKSVSIQMLKALLLKGESQVLTFKRGGETFKARIRLLDHQTGKLGVEKVE